MAIKFLPFALALIAALLGAAKAQTCTNGFELEYRTDNAGSWNDLYKIYRNIGYCDDGALAEGLDDKVAKFLAWSWRDLDYLATLSTRDKGFRRFVLLHISATADQNDMKELRDNADRHCPKIRTRFAA
jgi:hypothetical protein